MQHPSHFDWVDDPQARKWLESTLDWLDSDEPRAGDDDELANPESPLWVLPLADQLSNHIASQEDDYAIRPSTKILLHQTAKWLLQSSHEAAQEDDEALDLAVVATADRLYQATYRFPMPEAAGMLLQSIAWNRREESLECLTENIVERPPIDWAVTAMGISPLVRSHDWPVEAVFPRLLDGLLHPTTISPILDLSNLITRHGRVQRHPAYARREELISLLGHVVSRLSLLEEDPKRFGDTVQEVQHVLAESVALCVSLCDALGMIGDQAAVGKLNQALELTHRRVQAEAAAALARMGDKAGHQRLLELVTEPVTRLRVLAYAEELNVMNEIDEQFTTPQARGEAELALWLSQPQQMGIPPSEMEFVDERVMFWPGYEEPQTCFLYRYTYKFPAGELSNIGISGPLVHAVSADLADLPVDDIYAIFAGWHAEHPDIYEVDAAYFNRPQQVEAKKLARHLEEEGHESVEPLFLGFFIGERALVARTELNQTPGIAVTDGLEIVWHPTAGRSRPLGPIEVYCLYKGRKILRTFNV